MLFLLASCKFGRDQPKIKGTSLENKKPSRQYLLSYSRYFPDPPYPSFCYHDQQHT